ncbi:MAG: hypothetical protein KC456_10465 [Flavobacteriales bacterium]|jgi:hypothetical protein|nr:hypothetical protein [Flavobacteriales bacterium]
MRRLLFSLSLAICLIGCSDKKTESKNTKVENPPAGQSAKSEVPNNLEVEPQIQEEPKVLRSNAPEVKEAGKATPQAATVDEGQKEMPSHAGPEQSKIDSIKAAKQKGKK